MRTYRELFGAPEFTPLFLSSSLHVAASTVSGLALGVLVYGATGSPLLAALSMFGQALAQVVGATVLMSAADRVPPRAALVGLAALFAVGTAVQAVPGMPVWALFVVLFVMGAAASLGGGVRYGLLNEILAREGYLLGRSVMNMATGLMQVAGFAVGGVLITLMSPRGALLLGAGLYLGSAVITRFGLTERAPRVAGRASVTETWRTNRLLWSSRPRRYTYLALWVPNGLVVGCEALFVPYDPERAGLLFAFAALGMFIGDTVAGRFLPPRWRARLDAPLRLLLAVPYVVFLFGPPTALAAVAVTLASVGFASTLLLQERLMALTPEELSGQALGLHGAGMMTAQGLAAGLAGAVAQWTSPSVAIGVMAAMSVAVTVALAPGLRGPVDAEPSWSVAGGAGDAREAGSVGGDGSGTGGADSGGRNGPQRGGAVSGGREDAGKSAGGGGSGGAGEAADG
ncbi:MFS transporter [Streptomyces uncialis]|uniref:MFS transporter n=1 Tax=Streptomyces uncialis TaxID=1048205 RepID=UPI002E318BEB|nr:MFS transporter [Streptomyces uncialis]